MCIKTLHISGFRNLSDNILSFSDRLNLLFGDNAAGKTSILEAIYYLGTGKSFRTHQFEPIIQHNKDDFSLFARVLDDSNEIPIGTSRSRNGVRQTRLNEKNVSSIAEISDCLPIQFIGTTSHRILIDGPKFRREFLDWGLFYTSPSFYSEWKQYQKTLFHRNAALKAHAPRDELMVWNQSLSSTGEKLNLLRQQYFQEFLPHFEKIIALLLPSPAIQLSYFQGWDPKQSLEACLTRSFFRELQLGYTLYGPHRADLCILVNEISADDYLSQGQQKLVSYALRLAQGFHLKSVTSKKPIYLIDDLPSELDACRRQLVADLLSGISAQIFLTGIDKNQLLSHFSAETPKQLFHVKHGGVYEEQAASIA